MKHNRIISIFLFFLFIFLSTQNVAFAEDKSSENVVTSYHDDMITIHFHNETSTETQEKIIAHFKGTETFSIEPKGITCTLLGHNIETGTTTTITHKAKATAPRCLSETFDYEVCSRCDYSEYTLISSRYVYCCSE